MTDILRKTLNVIRQHVGQYINGIWVDGDNETISIKASVQPTPAEEMETLPEGYRTKESFTLFTSSVLKASLTNATNADFVVINDEKYRVVKVAPWQNNLINHYECIVVKEDQDDVD